MDSSTRGTARKSPSVPVDRGRATTSTRKTEAPLEARAEIAGYIAQLAAEMAEMAGLDTLAYFLSMARLEAEMERRQNTSV